MIGCHKPSIVTAELPSNWKKKQKNNFLQAITLLMDIRMDVWVDGEYCPGKICQVNLGSDQTKVKIHFFAAGAYYYAWLYLTDGSIEIIFEPLSPISEPQETCF
jgi:hypothetical protein